MGSTRSFVQSIDYVCKKRQNHPLFGQISYIETLPTHKIYTSKTIKSSVSELPKFITQLIPNNSPLINPCIQLNPTPIHYLQVYKIDSTKSILTACSYQSFFTLYLPSLQIDLQTIQYTQNCFTFTQKQLLDLITCILDGITILNRMKIPIMPIQKKTVILQINQQDQCISKYDMENACWMVVPLPLCRYQMWDNMRSNSKCYNSSPQKHIKQLGQLIIQLLYDQQKKNKNISTSTHTQNISTQQNNKQLNYNIILQQSNISTQLKQIILSMLTQQQKDRIGMTILLDICIKLKNRKINIKHNKLDINNRNVDINNQQQQQIIIINKTNKKQDIKIQRVSQQSRLRGLSSRKNNQNKNKRRSMSIHGIHGIHGVKQFNAKQEDSNYYVLQPRSINSYRNFTSTSNVNNIQILLDNKLYLQQQNLKLNNQSKPSLASNFSFQNLLTIPSNPKISILTTPLKNTPILNLHKPPLPKQFPSKTNKLKLQYKIKQQNNQNKYECMRFKNGAYYEGQIDENNSFNGFGTLYYSEHKVCYAGFWKDNCFNGFGKLYNQQIYTKSKQNYKNLQVNFHNFELTSISQNLNQKKQSSSSISQQSNISTLYSTSRESKAQLQKLWERYEGEFKNDQKHGYGILYFVDGSKFEGQFIDGKANGTGSFMNKNGNIVDGVWKDNKLVNEY